MRDLTDVEFYDLRCAITRLMGWEKEENSAFWSYRNGSRWMLYDIPEYTIQLNAAVVAERDLIRTVEQQDRYWKELAKVVEPSTPFEMHVAWPWQRCVALDRTFNSNPVI